MSSKKPLRISQAETLPKNIIIIKTYSYMADHLFKEQGEAKTVKHTDTEAVRHTLIGQTKIKKPS